MFCRNCGKKLESDAKFCDECGTKVINEEVKKKTKKESSEKETTNISVSEVPISRSKGTASLVLGILSLFIGIIFIPIPIVGLILGIIQKKKDGVAIAGIIINAFSLVGIILLWIIMIFGFFIYRDEVNYNSRQEIDGSSNVIINGENELNSIDEWVE